MSTGNSYLVNEILKKIHVVSITVNVQVEIFTLPNARLSRQDVTVFNGQYPPLTAKHMTVFHDRFLIIDETDGYHLGASIKDAGKKC